MATTGCVDTQLALALVLVATVSVLVVSIVNAISLITLEKRINRNIGAPLNEADASLYSNFSRSWPRLALGMSVAIFSALLLVPETRELVLTRPVISVSVVTGLAVVLIICGVYTGTFAGLRG